MFLLNLSLAEFLGLFGAVSAVMVALYLLDRAKKRQMVATLRFWMAAEKPTEMKHRRRIQQPWSLILQLLSIALLLLAIAQLRLGSPDRTSRDNVIILDTSAWMAAQTPSGTLMQEARAAARRYLRALPSSDRVMLVRADAMATPATGFESNRKSLESAIDDSQPSSAALNLSQALEFARQMQRLKANRAGEIVVIGSGRITSQDAALLPASLENLRVIPLTETVENSGLHKVGLRRSPKDPDLWEIFVSVRNYGRRPQPAALSLQFGGAPVGSRRMMLQPGSEQNATFEYRTRAAGWLEARLITKDGFPSDDSAVLELPAQRTAKVTVYSDNPAALRPLLSANPHLEAVFRAPSAYTPDAAGGIVIFDRFRPAAPPVTDSIWIAPPAGNTPAPVRSTVKNVPLARWNSEHPLATGLHAKGLRLDSADVFAPASGDIRVAETAEGPVILARPGSTKMVILGFDPFRSAMRYELATPLLFANILHWMAPDIFRRWELNAGSVGTVNAELDAEVSPSAVKIVADNQLELPYTVEGKTVRFFTGTPGTVRLLAGDREMVYSLTLPEVAEAQWSPPSTARRGVPAKLPDTQSSQDLWRLLAIIGALGLLAEWLIFGRSRIKAPVTVGQGVRYVEAPGKSKRQWLRRRNSGSIRKAS